MSVTMRDVAQHAGVSITTVSHVLNSTREVSEDLTIRVQQAVEELGYKHRSRRIAKPAQTYMIALLLPDPSDEFFQELARGVEEHAEAHMFNIVSCNTNEDPQREQFYSLLMQHRGVQGLIIAPTTADASCLQSVVSSTIPVVLVDRHIPSLDVHQVYSDNLGGAVAATEHLLGLGHKRIGLITGMRGITTTENRLNGYRKALHNFGIPEDESLIVNGRSNIEEGYAAAQKALAQGDVTAILSTNTRMTLGVLRFLRDGNFHCPSGVSRSVSLVSFDDPCWAESMCPPLTAVAQDPYGMGYTAGELLFESIKGEADLTHKKQHIELETKLIVRESSGPPPM